MEIIMRSVGDLKPHPANPRIGHAIGKIVKSMETFGFTNPILTQKGTDYILAGHGRIEAAKKMNLKEVPVIELALTDTQAKAYLITDNKLTDSSEFDDDLLKNLLLDLKIENFDLDITGFNTDELIGIDVLQKQEADEIPEIPTTPRAKRGEIYILNRHRIMCGDSTNEGDVALLMDGKKADMCFTDPPYSVNYASRKENPDQTLKSYQDPKNPRKLLKGFLSIMPSDCLMMTYADKQLHSYVLTLEELGFETIDVLIWKKQHFCFWPGARYQQMHELIFLARKIGSKFYSNTPANRSTVFEVDRKMKNEVHPTEKPAVLWDELLSYHSVENEIIYDAFLGSGTTLISCEKMKRICYGMEISECYCDVIIKRYCNFTGANEEEIYASVQKVTA
jgi:DNA modification methylase